jgi:hypothetical protein
MLLVGADWAGNAKGSSCRVQLLTRWQMHAAKRPANNLYSSLGLKLLFLSWVYSRQQLALWDGSVTLTNGKRNFQVSLSHHHELENTKAVIQIVRDEEKLQTGAVISQLVRYGGSCEEGLLSFYRPWIPEAGASPVNFFQLTRGSKDEKALASIMDEFGHAKTNLIVHIQVAGVGLMRTIGDKVVANATVVNRVDSLLQQKIGEGQGLKVAELIKNRFPRGMCRTTRYVTILAVNR